VPRPRVGISRCLLGDAVRYDGGHKLDASLVETLGRAVEWVPVCPEVEVGMGTPREPIQLVTSAAGGTSAGHRVRLVGVESGRDWTDDMDRWSRARVADLSRASLSGFVVKSRSPSCGLEGGLFTQTLLRAMPDLPVEDEERLRDARVRDAFLERVFAYERAARTLA
jgi:uncharacterized protein YbbK (DUF523 family)